MGNDQYSDIESILHGLFKPPTLKELFEQKLVELRMAPTTALGILGFGSIPLKRLLEGSETMVDIAKLFKLADFLQLPKGQVVKMYAESLERTHYQISDVSSPDKVKFIKKNFDLATLRKAGFIESISDFQEIEKRILSRLGMKSIMEYSKPPVDIAFSSTEFKPDHHLTRSFWTRQAIACFEELANPYDYKRDKLIEYFPEIRWHSTKPENGLHAVVRRLFKLGVTVIFLPGLENLKVRGATMVVNGKPCIVLTNLFDFYPSLWFTLIHELYHVLLDLEEIRESKYHLSDDSNDQASVQQREALADEFAREYLLPREKMEKIRARVTDATGANAVHDFAIDNHIHPSIIYAFHAFERGKLDRKAWMRTRRHSPPLAQSIIDISFSWNDGRSIEEICKERKIRTYN